MTLYYEAGFSVNASALSMTGTWASTAVTVGTGTYAHQSLVSVMGTGNYSDFATAVQSAINTATGSSFTVSYSTSTHQYTISRATTFTMLFDSSVAGNVRLAAALGFSTGTHSGASAYTSDVRPYYVMVPTELARSAMLPFVYEPDDIVEEAVSDGGTPYAVAKNTTELWADWTQTMEAKAACFDLYATSAAPWTWQKFFKHVRGQHPFAVYESALYDAVYKSRAESARFKPQPVTADWDALYNIRFETRYIGAIASAASVGLDLSSGGTFARALEASYYLSAPTTGSSAFLAWASSGVRRVENRGDGLGAGLLMEKAATNSLVQSRALNTSWTAGTATLTADQNGGPDAAGLADRENATSGQYGSYQGTPGPSGRVVGSIWTRAVSGTGTQQVVLLHNGAGAALAAHATATTTTWSRNDTTGSATTNSGLISVDARDQSGVGGQTATAQDVYLDLAQLEVGYYPTSAIRTTTVSVTRPKDTLSYAVGSYPASFLTDGFTLKFAPDASSAEIYSEGGAGWALVVVGTAGDILSLKPSGTAGSAYIIVTAGGSDVAETGALTFSRGQALTITYKPSTGYLSVSGATTGNGNWTANDGPPADWTSGQTLYIGNGSGGTTPVTGRYLDARGGALAPYIVGA